MTAVMSGDISLTAGMRSNLLSLQDTSKKIGQTQLRLSTGKKVNTALDNPTNYFSSQAALARASDLIVRKDGMSESVQMLGAATAGIKAISSLIDSAKGVVPNAAATNDSKELGALGSAFNTIISQISQLASDSSYKGTNFLTKGSQTVEFGQRTGASTLQISGFDSTAHGLGVSVVLLVLAYSTSVSTPATVGGSVVTAPAFPSSVTTSITANPQNYRLTSDSAIAVSPSVSGGSEPYSLTGSVVSGTFSAGASVSLEYFADGFDASGMPNITTPSVSWSSASGRKTSMGELDSALSTLRTKSSALSSSLSVVTTRQDFSDTMIETLQTGSDNLVLADMDEEGANMLMLQTRQNLGISSLSIASQSSQAVLRLF